MKSGALNKCRTRVDDHRYVRQNIAVPWVTLHSVDKINLADIDYAAAAWKNTGSTPGRANVPADQLALH